MKARWQSGYAAACKAEDIGSIPVWASNLLKGVYYDKKTNNNLWNCCIIVSRLVDVFIPCDQFDVLGDIQMNKYPKPRRRRSAFGMVPPPLNKVLQYELQSDNFLVSSLNYYNALECGTTQLYNECIVYNKKISGMKKISGQNYRFINDRKYPLIMSEAFLYVDMMNNIDLLAEDLPRVKALWVQKVAKGNTDAILECAKQYGTDKTVQFCKKWFLQMREGWQSG